MTNAHARASIQVIGAAILLALAQPAAAQEKTWRVGLLTGGGAETPQLQTSWRGELLRVLAQNGFREGRNLELVARYAENHISIACRRSRARSTPPAWMQPLQ